MKHHIRKSFFHKGYVFLFSVVETFGFWSTHKTEDDHTKGTEAYRQKFQAEHDRQVDTLYEQAVKEEGMFLAQNEGPVDDRTAESRLILNKRN